MLKLDNVNKYFNRKKSNEIHVIGNTSLEMGDNGLVAMLGSSGCGKTTLLNAIGGLDRIDSGDIYVNGKNISGVRSGKRDDIRNANIGYIFQNYNLLEDMTVFDNVAIALKMIGIKDKAEIEARVMYILKQVGIDRYRNRPAKMLSGGERQRVGIARAIVKNPRIIIADEPTGNLDSGNTIEIMNIIKAISRERLVILVTHEKEIAEFYASRIIRISDGCVISDEVNEHDGNLNYRLDNRIYMQDLPHREEFEGDGVKVRFFSDDSVDLDNIEVRVVIKNGSIYLDTKENIKEGYAGTKLIDDTYKALSKDVYEKYTLDEDMMVSKDYAAKYTSIFNPVSLVTSGFKKVFSYSLIKKILLAGFLLAAMVSTYAMSNIAGTVDIKDSQFVTTNQNYVTVKTGKLSADQFEKLAEYEGVKYAIAGDAQSYMKLPLDDYYQTSGNSTTVSGSLAARTLLDESCIVAGKKPEGSHEIAIDVMCADSTIDLQEIQMLGIKDYEGFIGRTVDLGVLGTFTITAVTEQGSPSIYVKKSYINDMLISPEQDAAINEYGDEEEVVSEDTSSEITPWKLYSDDSDICVASGEAPDELYEVMLPKDMQSSTCYVGVEIDKKVCGHKLKVCGFYTDKRNRGMYFVSKKTALNNFITSKKQVTLCTDDKDTLVAALKADGYNAVDPYVQDRKAFVTESMKQMKAAVIAGLIVILISLVEMYLMLRSSFLSRIKEVGVLRAIGLKKRDIYKMFMGEIIAVSTLTAVPGVAITAYIMHSIAQVDMIGEAYFMNVPLAIATIALIFIFNLLAGLIPVFRTMRKTPAQILARNDIN